MGSSVDPETLRNIIAAIIAVVVYWIKTTIDKHANEIKSTLISINNSVSTTQTVNIYHPSRPIHAAHLDGHMDTEPDDET